MRYHFRTIAEESSMSPDLFVEDEGDFNEVVNPSIDIPQDVLDFLVSDRLQIIPFMPSLVNDWYYERTREMRLSCYKSSISNVSQEYAYLSELDSALEFIEKEGNISLRECLCDNERSLISKDKFGEDVIWNEIIRLSDIIDSLVLSPKIDEALDRPRLTPRGFAAYWFLVDTVRPKYADEQLDRAICDWYHLPSTDSYSFLPWKYLTEMSEKISGHSEIWDNREELLKGIRLKPINHKLVRGDHDWIKYIEVRDALYGNGVRAGAFAEIETNFVVRLKNDLIAKNSVLRNSSTVVFGKLFQSDKPCLYEAILEQCKTILMNICKSSDDQHLRSFYANQLKNVLDTDLLAFAAFYNYVFIPHKLVELCGRAAAKYAGRDVPSVPKPGRPIKNAKTAILPFRRAVVEILQSHGVYHPFDKAAKLLNALANSEVYSERSVGELDLSDSVSIEDPSRSSQMGYLTKGGKVLYNELRKEIPPSQNN